MVIDDIAAFEGRSAKVEGPAHSGKTEALVQRVLHLLRADSDPQSILVVVTSGFAAQAFRERLERAAGGRLEAAAAEVRVCTAVDACAEALDAPEARAYTDRVPRLLNQAERNFFLEDLKATGASPRALRRALALRSQASERLQPQACEGASEEEQAVFAAMDRLLSAQGAMLPEEAPALGVSWLESEAAAAAGARGAFACVLCDDWQNLSRAQQRCLELLAGDQLVVAGNPNETIESATQLPNPQGLSDFEREHEDARAFKLEGAFGDAAVTRFADALCEQEGMDPAWAAGAAKPAGTATDDGANGGEALAFPAGIEAIKWSSPEDEVEGMAKYLAAQTKQDEDARACRSCVVVPNRRWAGLFDKALRKHGVKTSTAGATAGLSGDPRDSSKAQALVAYVKLDLVAHPRDMTAWRCWCGFDDRQTNADAWAGLVDYAEDRGLPLYDALAGLPQDEESPFPKSGLLAKRFAEGRAFIEKFGSLKSLSLMHAAGASELPEYKEVRACLVGTEDAATLQRIVRDSMSEPTWPANPHVLHIATSEALCGCSYENVFFVGAVEGLLPGHAAVDEKLPEAARERVLERERRRFAAAAAKAERHLGVSYFVQASPQLAERTKMRVLRTREEKGKKVAIVPPTRFLSETGDAEPTTTGGQALLGKHGLN